MKIYRAILKFFAWRKTFRSLFADALNEGIKDTSKEMGYVSRNNDGA